MWPATAPAAPPERQPIACAFGLITARLSIVRTAKNVTLCGLLLVRVGLLLKDLRVLSGAKTQSLPASTRPATLDKGKPAGSRWRRASVGILTSRDGARCGDSGQIAADQVEGGTSARSALCRKSLGFAQSSPLEPRGAFGEGKLGSESPIASRRSLRLDRCLNRDRVGISTESSVDGWPSAAR